MTATTTPASTTSTTSSTRTWPYIGLALGGGVSVACNVGHAFVAAHAAGTGGPAVGAVALSVVWPVMVLVAVELLTRTVWPAGWAWLALRVTGPGLVAVVAAAVSYRHMAGLLQHYREDAVVVAIGPIAVDVLMTLSTAALIVAARVEATTTLDPATSTTVEGAVTGSPVVAPSSGMQTPTVDPVVEPTPSSVEVDRPARPSTPPAASTPSTLDERVAAVRALIASGVLAPAPSAEAIRRAAGGSAAIARAVRDAVAGDVIDVQVPGQLDALDALDVVDEPARVLAVVR